MRPAICSRWPRPDRHAIPFCWRAVPARPLRAASTCCSPFPARRLRPTTATAISSRPSTSPWRRSTATACRACHSSGAGSCISAMRPRPRWNRGCRCRPARCRRCRTPSRCAARRRSCAIVAMTACICWPSPATATAVRPCRPIWTRPRTDRLQRPTPSRPTGRKPIPRPISPRSLRRATTSMPAISFRPICRGPGTAD